jgi:hypothetical protein
MATSTRQFGRRGTSNATASVTTNNATSRGPVSPLATGTTATPPRRYVLDVPTSRTTRTSRTATSRVNDEYDDTNSRYRSGGTTTSYSGYLPAGVNDENIERISRSGSREYYYRDGGSESSATTGNRYLEDTSMRQLLESGTGYTNTAIEDQEVQALTARATPDVKNYPINVDANPELIVRPNTQRLTYTQDIAVRYLRPSTPPPPGVKFLFS